MILVIDIKSFLAAEELRAAQENDMEMSFRFLFVLNTNSRQEVSVSWLLFITAQAREILLFIGVAPCVRARTERALLVSKIWTCNDALDYVTSVRRVSS